MRLLVVFDDFEQNLTPGGEGSRTRPSMSIFTALADAAETGGAAGHVPVPAAGPGPVPGPDPGPAAVAG